MVSHSADFKGITLVSSIIREFFLKEIHRFISALLSFLLTFFPTLGEYKTLASQLIGLLFIKVTSNSVSASKFRKENQSIFETFVCLMDDVLWDPFARLINFVNKSQHMSIVEIALRHLVDSPKRRNYFIDLLNSLSVDVQSDLAHRLVEECVKVLSNSKWKMLVGPLEITLTLLGSLHHPDLVKTYPDVTSPFLRVVIHTNKDEVRPFVLHIYTTALSKKGGSEIKCVFEFNSGPGF